MNCQGLMKTQIKIIASIFALFLTTSALADSLFQTGVSAHGLRDFREVMPNVLYRGGARTKQHDVNAPMTGDQQEALCEQGIGDAFYLYSTGMNGPTVKSCANGQMNYAYKSWEGSGRDVVLRTIYNSIKNNGKPVFVHCWYGIHATGAVAALALRQFCDMSAETAVEYWKVGIAKQLQYQKVIDQIRAFQPNPSMHLTEEEKGRVCPRF